MSHKGLKKGITNNLIKTNMKILKSMKSMKSSGLNKKIKDNLFGTKREVSSQGSRIIKRDTMNRSSSSDKENIASGRRANS